MHTVLGRIRVVVREDPVLACMGVLVACMPLLVSPWYIEQYDTVKYGAAALCTGLGMWYAVRRGVVSRVWHSKLGALFLGALALFVLWSFIVTVRAVDVWYAVVGFYNRFGNSLVFHVLFAGIALCVLCVPRLRQISLVRVATCAAILAAVWSLGDTVWTLFTVSGVTEYTRGPGLLGNPNFSSMYFAVILPLCGYCAARATSSIARVWYTVGIALLAGAVLLSASRGALLALGIAILVGIVLGVRYLRTRRLYWISLMGVGVVIVVLGIGLLFWARPQAVHGVLADANVQDRLGLWEVSAQAIKNRPWFGVGLGNIVYALETDRGTHVRPSVLYDDVHNVFLTWGVSGGLPMLLLGAGLLVVAVICAYVRLRKGDSFAFAVLLSLVVWIVAAFFTPVSVSNFVLLAVIVGLVVGDLGATEFSLPKWMRLSGHLYGAGMVLVAVCFLLGEAYSGKGYHEFKMGEYAASAAHLRIGTALNPTNPYARLFLTGAVIQNRAGSETASPLISRFASLHPKYSRFNLWVGHVWALQFYATRNPEYMDVAGAALQVAVAQQPAATQPRYALAQHHLLTHRPDLARQQLEIITSHDSNFYPGWLLLAKMYQDSKERSALLEALRHAARSAPHDTLVYDFLTKNHGKDLLTQPLEVPLILGAL